MKCHAVVCLLYLLSSVHPLSSTQTVRNLRPAVNPGWASGPSSSLSLTQEPKPQDPSPEKRGIGVEASPSPTPNQNTTNPPKPFASKPEIVLQAGITSPQTQLAFSPDGRLLASMGWSGNAVKIWEIASGRLLRQIDTGVPSMGSSSVSRPFRFSHDGQTLLVFAEERLRRWDVNTGRELNSTLLTGAKNSTMALLSENGSTLASLNLQNTIIRLWDTTTGRELTPIKLDDEEDRLSGQDSIALSPDGKLIATVSERFEGNLKGMKSREQLTFWNVGTAKKSQTLTIRSDAYNPMTAVSRLDHFTNIAFSSDGLWVAVRTKDSLKVWDVGSGKELRAMATPAAANTSADQGLSSLISKFVFSPDKQRVLLISEGKKLSLVDISDGSVSRNIEGHEGPIVAVSYSLDGQTLASSGLDNQIRLWDASTGTEIRSLTGAALPVSDLAFSKDGKSLSMAAQTAASFWELNNGGVRRSISLGDDYSSHKQGWLTDRGSLLSPDGRFMIAGSHLQPSAKLWDLTLGKESANVSLGQGKVVANAAFNSDGRLLAVLEGNAKKPEIYSPVAAGQTSGSSPAGPIAMPDPTKLMEQMRKDPKKMQAEIKKAQEAAAQGDLSAGLAMMETLGLMPTTKKTNSNPNNLRIVEAATGRQVRAFPLASNFLSEMTADSMISSSAISFSPDGRVLASAAGYNAPVQLLEVETGKQLFTLKSPFSVGVNSLAWSPDGKRLASSQWGMRQGMTDPDAAENFSFEDLAFSIKLWDPQTGSEITKLTGHNNLVMKLSFSRDGKLLASGGYDGLVKLWDVNSGRELHTLRGHTGTINALTFSPDGRFIVSGSDDGSARLWKVENGEFLATLASLNSGNDWLVITPSGLFDGSPGGWNQIMWRFSPALNDVSPVEIFFNEYFHPGLLADILEGKQLAVTADISRKDRRQPKLSLSVADAANGTINKRMAKVTIAVSSAPAGAQDVRLFRNGSLVKLWRGDVLQGQSNSTLETTVAFVGDANELRAYAFNRDNVKSTDAVLRIQGDASLKRKGTLHLIVAGVNQYANPGYNLKYAVADGQAFAAELVRQQQKLPQYSQFEVITLFDQQATKANLNYALKRLAGAATDTLPPGASPELSKLTTAQPEDAVVLYFAGHGTAQEQRFYLIPHDLGYRGPRTELDEAGLREILSHSVSDLELEEAFVGIDAGLSLLVIDACNSGQALETAEKRRGPMNSKGLAQLAYEKGMYILTAAQSYQAALEAEQLGHGYLTFALVEEGLKSVKADNEPADGQVLLREWLNYATERVPEMQEQKMRSARGLKIEIAFVEGEEKLGEVDQRNVQRPRVFYRREAETQPIVVAKP
jgi:WD40 repeat protein